MGLEEGPCPTEEEQKPQFQETLHKIYQTMQEYNIYAVRIWTNNRLFDLAHSDPQIEQELENKVLERLQKDRNGYLVFEGAVPDSERQTVIFKMKLDNSSDSRETGHNEEYFYEDIIPKIEEGMPGDLEYIKIPELYESGHSEEGSYIVTKFAEGEQVGRVRETEIPLSSEEYDEVVKFIRFIQDFSTLDRVKTLSPRMEVDENATTYDEYEKLYNSHQEMIIKMLGEDYSKKMEEQLSESEELLKDSPKYVVNVDIIPSNLIRSKENLYVIDWERLRVVTNPAAAYGHLIEAHWHWPEMQSQMIRRAIELNKDIPDFKEFLRLDMIYFKYSIGYWWDIQKENNPPEKQERYEAGAKALVEFMKDAIDKKGVWAEEAGE